MDDNLTRENQFAKEFKRKYGIDPYNHLTNRMAETTDYGHYATLRDILNEAYEQAATGKGKERHANDRPWSAQPIAEIGRMVGVGFNLGQAMKKLQEASRMEGETAVRELLGAIVYAASAVMLIRDDEQNG